MTVDRPDPWYADLPELDDRGRQAVLEVICDVLVYRDVTRDDVREAFEMAQRPEGGSVTEDRRRTSDGSFISVDAARQEFTDALKGVELSAAEARTVAWLLDCDQPTLHNLVTLFGKLRASLASAWDQGFGAGWDNHEAHAREIEARIGSDIRLPFPDPAPNPYLEADGGESTTKP